MPTLAIGEHVIRQIDGLYSLNDLHAASGSGPAHRPNQFVRNAQTRALIAELSNAQIRAFETRRGAGGGTYACRELLIAYAAWISAAFHLKVIRIFLAATAQETPTLPRLPPRNLLKGTVEGIRHVCAFTSGDVGLHIPIPDEVYTQCPVHDGEQVYFEFAPSANPLNAPPIAIHKTSPPRPDCQRQ